MGQKGTGGGGGSKQKVRPFQNNDSNQKDTNSLDIMPVFKKKKTIEKVPLRRFKSCLNCPLSHPSNQGFLFVYFDPNSGRNFGLTQPNFGLTQGNFGLTQEKFLPNSNFRPTLCKI